MSTKPTYQTIALVLYAALHHFLTATEGDIWVDPQVCPETAEAIELVQETRTRAEGACRQARGFFAGKPHLHARLEAIEHDQDTPNEHRSAMPTNAEPAQRARIALEVFIAQDLPAYRDEDKQTQLSDLYCNLHHLADQLGLDWEQIAARGNNHYTAEGRDSSA